MRFNCEKPKIQISLRDAAVPFFYIVTDAVINKIINNKIDIDFDVYLPTKEKNLQRPLCWTDKQKSELIRSVMRLAAIPHFAILEIMPSVGNKNTYKIIDGKQRLSTIIGFIKGLVWVESENGERLFFSDLTKEEISQFKRGLTNLRANVACYGDIEHPTDAVLIEWFEFLNFAGTPQDEQHILNLKK